MTNKIELFQVIKKTTDGRFVGILSDTSLDRDGEIVGEEAFDKVLGSGVKKVRLMIDHKNEVLNRIGNWTNLRKERRGDHVALVGEPKFFESNPKAQIIKGMLDEGAELDISIGALVKDYETVKMNDRDVKKFTDIELLEGSFVGIGSNRNSSGMKDARLKIAKMFETKMEEETMEKNEEVEKVVDPQVEELNKKLEEVETKNKELENKMEEIKKEAEEALAAKEEAEAKVESAEGEKTEAEEAAKNLTLEVEELKKETVKKAIIDSPAGEEAEKKDLISKEVEAGALPVMKK